MRQDTMKTLVLLALLGIGLHGADAATHSLKYFFTASSGVPNFPEFVAVGLVDEVQMFHYDSNTMKAEPKQDWMIRFTEDEPQYWEGQTGTCVGTQQTFKANIETAKQRFNHTEGVHIFQRMYGCEWDDETGEVNSFYRYGYDGKDLDLKTWIAHEQQADITKQKWHNNKPLITQDENYLTHRCLYRLKKYVDYGRSSLLRTVLPSVSLLQKTPSSPVSCHATGFNPDRAMMFWRKDGEELHEEVEQGEILPNHDGSFQMSVDLNLSSVTPEDWRRYDCVFHLSGVTDDIVTRLDKAVIRTNEDKTGIRNDEAGKPSDMILIIILVIIAAVVGLVLIAVIGLIIYKKKNAKSPPHESEIPSSNPSTENVQSNTPLMKGSETSSSTSSASSRESLTSARPLIKE